MFIFHFKSRTKQGKQLIDEFGSVWEIHRYSPDVTALNNQEGWLVAPRGFPKYKRWVAHDGSPNFKRIPTKELLP